MCAAVGVDERMKKLKYLSAWKRWDFKPKWFWISVAVITALKLFLTSFQMGYYTPDLAPLDDTLMYNMAVSITKGEWLGAYDWLTLSKHSFFALWLAVLHWLHIPYLIGGQALYAASCAALTGAFAPVLPERKKKFILYAALLYNPAATAAFTLRVYRDNIFPALCLLVFAGITGYVLRCTNKKAIGWLVLCGVGLGTVYLCREDGIWVWPFVLVAAGVAIWRLARMNETRRKKLRRMALLFVPVGVFAACLSAWAGMNQLFYGRFVVSDFTSSEFNAAYGALTRLEAGQEEDGDLIQIPLTKKGRQALYEAKSKYFTALKPWLEDADFQNGYANSETGEYPAGSFYWALRRAAWYAGYYETAQKAQRYFTDLAQEVNALCDSGALEAGPRRSSTAPKITPEYVLPVLKEGVYSLWFCATMQDTAPYMGGISVGRAEDQIQPMEEFLYTRANLAAKAGTAEPYYSPVQMAAYYVLLFIRKIYAVLLIAALAAALCRLFYVIPTVWKGRAQTCQKAAWLAVMGLIGMAVLRAMMIAFVEVASFGIGTYVMYLSSVHPLLIAAAAVGLLAVWKEEENAPAVSL